MQQDKIAKSVKDLSTLLEEAFQQQPSKIADFARQVVDVFHRDGKLILVGNGPQGAVANLVADLFLHRLSLERPLLPAVSLCHDVTLATALARDGLSRQFFARQLQALAGEGDVVLAFAGPHRDESLEEALTAARSLGCPAALLQPGPGEPPGGPPDFLFRVATDAPSRALEASLFFGHLLVELVEGEIFGI